MKNISETKIFEFSKKDEYFSKIMSVFDPRKDIHTLGGESRESVYRDPLMGASLLNISRQHRTATTALIVSALSNNEIGFLIDTRFTKLPSHFMFLPMSNGGKKITVLNLSKFMKDDNLVIDQVALLNLLTATYFAHITVKYADNITRSRKLLSAFLPIYTGMLQSAVIANTGIIPNHPIATKVRLLFGYFFIHGVVNVKISGLNTIKEMINSSLNLDTTIMTYNYDQVKNIDNMFGQLVTLDPKLEKLTYRSLLVNYANIFGSKTITNIEYLPYLVFTLMLANKGTNMLNSFSFERYRSSKQFSVISSELIRLGA